MTNLFPGKYNQNNRGYCQFTSFLSMLNQSLIKKLKLEYNIDCNYQISMNDLLKCLKDKLILNSYHYTKSCAMWSLSKAEKIGSGTVFSNGRSSPYKDYKNLEKILEFYIFDDMQSLSSINYIDLINTKELALIVLGRTLIENRGGGGPSGSAPDVIVWDISNAETIILPKNFPFANKDGITDFLDFMLDKDIYIFKKEKIEEIPIINLIANNNGTIINLLLDNSINFVFQDAIDATIADILIDTILTSTIETKLVNIPEGSIEILEQEKFSPDENEELGSGGFCCIGNSATNAYSSKADCINAGGTWIDPYYGFDVNEDGVCEKSRTPICNYDINCNYIKFKCTRKYINFELLDELLNKTNITAIDYINYLNDILTNHGSIDIGIAGWVCNWLEANNRAQSNINIIDDEWFEQYENIVSSNIPQESRIPESSVVHAVQLMRIQNNDNNYIFYIKNSWNPPLDYITITINKKYLNINEAFIKSYSQKTLSQLKSKYKSIPIYNMPIGEYASYIDFSSIQIIDKSEIICDSGCSSSSSSSSSSSNQVDFPVTFTLSNFTGLAENCNNYNGSYIIHQRYIGEEPASYNYSVEPPNSYATSASVDVGYSPNNDNVYICLNITTPDGSFQLCQQYDVDWTTGNYAIDWGGGFPSTPWCIGDIILSFTQ